MDMLLFGICLSLAEARLASNTANDANAHLWTARLEKAHFSQSRSILPVFKGKMLLRHGNAFMVLQLVFQIFSF
jgi:hypothetical protein